MQRITKLCFGMKLFDKDGGYFGRVCDLNLNEVTYLTPRQGTHTVAIAEAMGSCRRGYWLQQPDDAAVRNQWQSAKDVPESKPGLTFDDGVELGKAQAASAAKSVPAPPDWLYEEPELFMLSGDDFHDGYTSGFATEYRRLLLEKFPPGSHKPTPTEKTWESMRWGIDENDPLSVSAFKLGEKLANEQTQWLPELQADGLVDAVLESLPPTEIATFRIIAFRFGFKSRMEQRFPNRY